MTDPVIIGNATHNATIKEVVSCRDCDMTWRPSGNRTTEQCPNCGKRRDVRLRRFKPNIEKLRTWSRPKGYATKWEQRYRRRALMVVGRGAVACVRCGCDRAELLEINHVNGGGGKEIRGLGSKWHRQIAKMERSIDDLELLCRPCNAVHALELKHGLLPFTVVWGGNNG